MKFETVTFQVCCHTENLLPWQRDVTTCPLSFWNSIDAKNVLVRADVT